MPDAGSEAPGGPDHRGGQEPAGAGDAYAWTVKEAKARFSEVFDRALDRPQRISRRGKQAVVMMSVAEYERLRRIEVPKLPLVDFLASAPLAALDLERTVDLSRDVTF